MGKVVKNQKKISKRRRQNYNDLSYEELLPLMLPRQIRYAEELEKGGTHEEAYIRAGYSPRGAGSGASNLYNDSKFAAFRKARTAWLYAREGISKEWIGRERLKLYRDVSGAEPHTIFNPDTGAMEPDPDWQRDPKLAAEILKQMSADLEEGARGGMQVSITVPMGVDNAGEWAK